MKYSMTDGVTKDFLTEKIELVIDKLTHLGMVDEETQLQNAAMGRKAGMVARDFGIEEWDWPQGVGLYGLIQYDDYIKENRYMGFLQSWYESNLKRGLPSKNVNTTAPFLPLVNIIDKLNNKELEALCQERVDWLMRRLPRTEENVFQHVTSAIGDRQGVRLNDNEIWIDTIFMTVLFLNEMGQRYHRQDWIDEGIFQVKKHIEYLCDTKSGLFYHGYTFEKKNHFGGVFWCRGNSWFTYGIMDYIEAFQGTMDKELEEQFVGVYKNQVDALIKLQSSSGLWHTVLDDEDSYEEVSGSAGIVAGIIKGIRLGFLSEEEYQQAAMKAIKAICDNISQDGTVLNVSAGTGVGSCKEDYKKVMIAPMAYGQSLTLIALVEALRL